MGVIAKNDNQITLYYNSETSIGKQTYAYVKASELRVRAIDVLNTELTGTQWLELAGGLNLPISKLVNTHHPDFLKAYGDKKINLDENGWIKVLRNSPQVISSPIAIVGGNFVRIENPSDFTKYVKTDNAAIENPERID